MCQVEEAGSTGFDGFANTLDFVGAEVVHDHQVAGTERRRQSLLDPRTKAFAVDRAIEHARRGDPIMAQRGEEGGRLPVMGWTPPTASTCHGGGC
jgi:hypothetical protein